MSPLSPASSERSNSLFKIECTGSHSYWQTTSSYQPDLGRAGGTAGGSIGAAPLMEGITGAGTAAGAGAVTAAAAAV